ncbi:MAG: patatin-like phospholipase family protein, partial [Bacteroidota bacterium]
YSFPIQLLILHLRNNLLLIGIWILLALLMTGTIGRLFGVHYLFLAPEYLGEVNFFSFFFLGMAFGGFFITWNLTTYLLEAPHFPFLASLGRPFTKFCLNNFIIPLVFFGLYLFHTIRFQRFNEYWPTQVVVSNCAGFIIGLVVLAFLSALYFQLTNKDIKSYLKKMKHRPPNLLRSLAPIRDTANLEVVRTGISKWRVDTYLTESLRPRLVRSVAHYDSSVLLAVFKQNHVNALIVQLFGLVVLVTLGYLIDQPYFRIPAAASVFILASVLVAIAGAITYWFDRWRISVFIVILIGINYLTSYDMFNHKNKAYGLNYLTQPATYDYKSLDSICSIENQHIDQLATERILDTWYEKMRAKGVEKPKMVILCVSGGGMKAAVWSMQVLQKTDSLMQGALFDHATLITGASGGLIGTAYLRELYLQRQRGALINPYSSFYIDQVSKDLLNSLIFTIISNDLFLPWINFEAGGYIYKKDRGYIFEKQLNENTGGVLAKKMTDYRLAEQRAEIPMLFITPSVVNDGRRMIMSPHGVSYMMMAPVSANKRNTLEIDAVDFGKLFAAQGAADLQFTTALRMNATYPYILPNVYLPSKPSIEAMDAGFRDNFGIMSATRFIQVFKEWIKNNTSGVVLVQISSRNKIEEIAPSDHEGMIESILNPLGIVGQVMTLQDYEHDTNLGYIFDVLGEDKFEVIRFTYLPGEDNEQASMTFHLTRKEKKDILDAYYLPSNQASFRRLQKIMNDEKD